MIRKIAASVLSDSQRKGVGRAVHRLVAPMEFIEDGRRYLRNCAPSDGLADDSLRGRQLECQLTKDYHRVEKGLALGAPRATFGADVGRRLAMLIPVGNAFAARQPFVRYAEDASAALSRWNAGGGVDERISPLAPSPQDSTWTGDEAESFLTSRRSIRHFDQHRRPDAELLERAVAMAAHTPSVCNRQAWKIRLFSGDRVQHILRHQNGNAGFRSEVPWVGVVTVDTRLFAGLSERNQPWIDGGLFSMSLVYALHGLGIQTCMLNLSVTNAHARTVRAAIGADDAEQVIMMIAIGYAASDHRIARSPRRDVREIVEFVD